MERAMKRWVVLMASLCGAAVLASPLTTAGPGTQAASQAYKGHENDADIGNLVRRFPAAAGTRLDDCQTCHRAGAKGTDAGREYSPCGYCHLLGYPNPRYKTGVPGNYGDTLNAFGLAYRNAGRNVEALGAIAGLDSDRDGFADAEEIAALRFPGDPASRPGQPLAVTRTLSRDDVARLPSHSQFMLMNTPREPTDDYVTFRGVTVLELLKAAGVDPAGAAGITVFAPDGFSIDYGLVDIVGPFPAGVFYAGPGKIADPERAFVKYPARPPAGVEDGRPIPGEPWLLLAYEREGQPLEPSSFEKGTGRLAGEGPFRLIKPQRDLMGDPSRPGRPDRSRESPLFGDGWDFSPAIDHNAGFCVRGACVIRVNPMPAGVEEYDWRNGWRLAAEGRIVIYGRGVK